MNILAGIGDRALRQWRLVRQVSAIISGVLFLAFQARFWPRTVRELLVRQILFTGVEALGLVTLIAVLAGISVVTQTQFWLVKFGNSGMLGPLLVAVLIREVGPLLVNFVVIGRSGTAVSTELANMKVHGETDVLDAQGIDSTVYLAMPRVLGITVSVFCLAVIFVVVSCASGYAFGFLLGVTRGDPLYFMDSIAAAVSPRDIANFIAKTLWPGLITGALCCYEGLSVRGSLTEVPQAATRGVVRSLAALLIVSAIISVLTYL